MFASLATVMTADAQSAYLSTDFSDGIPSTFTLYDNDQNEPSSDMKKLGFAVGKPWIATKVDKDSNSVACSTSWYKKAGTSDDWMVTPAITIGSEKAVLSWRAKTRDKDYRDGYKVYVSTKGAAIADFDTSAPLFSVGSESYEWAEHLLSLADYNGKTVWIAFVNDSRDKSALYVDDLFVGVPSALGFTTSLSRVIPKQGEVTVEGEVFATGTTAVNGYTIGYDIDGQRFEQQFTNTLQPGDTATYQLSQPFNIALGETVGYSTWAKSGTDSVGISGRATSMLRRIVAEEITGTWCGYCVRGIVAMQKARAQFPDNFIGIAVHNSTASWPDSMAVGVEGYLDTLMSKTGMSGFPHAVVNRNAMYSIDPAYIPYYTENILKMDYYDGVRLDEAILNDETGQISAKATAFFARDYASSDFRFVYVLIENNVHRTHAESGVGAKETNGYDQNNYYAGNAMGEMGGFENKPSTVDAGDMWYQDVARAIAPCYGGVAGSVPSEISEGDEAENAITFALPENILKKENLELAVLLLDKNGNIANADKLPLSVQTSGVSTLRQAAGESIYYDLSGRRVMSPQSGRIYLHRHGGTVEKVAL